MRLAGAGLQLPGLTALALTNVHGGDIEAFFDAMPALRELRLDFFQVKSFTASGVSSLCRLADVHLISDRLPCAGALLAAAAPSLRSLQLRLGAEAWGAGVVAALDSLRQLTALCYGSRTLLLLLPRLPAGTQLRELVVPCPYGELTAEDIYQLASLPRLQRLQQVVLHRPDGVEQEQEQARLQVMPSAAKWM